MSFFSDWESCMTDHGMPVPNVESAGEALELLDQLHSAAENASIELGQVVTIGMLLATPGIAELLGESGVLILAGVAQTLAAIYISQGVSCVFAVAAMEVKRRFASNDLPDFMTEILAGEGHDLTAEAVA